MAETGAFFLIFSWVMSILQTISPSGKLTLHPDNQKPNFILACTKLSFYALAFSYLILTYTYFVSDFSVKNVAHNSNIDQPLLYKIAGVWGNHEGSMLLWALFLAAFGFHTAITKDFSDEELRIKAVRIHGALSAMIGGFIIFTSNPFARLFPFPAQGADLNPLLQDPGLAFHPPMLYSGYVGFSAVFAVACAALWQGKITKIEGDLIARRCLFAWTGLTAGIALGSWWAYYELGWGGFWFWDPVENASLLPWLSGTALLHSASIFKKTGKFKRWTIFLAIITFSASLLGSFIVRSGVITSVHSFASSPERGVVIMLIFLLSVFGAFALFARRAALLRSDEEFDTFSKEGAVALNNYFLCGILAIVFLGLMYPLFLEAFTGKKIAVGAPYYNAAIAPFAYGIAFCIPFGIMLGSRGKTAKQLLKNLAPAAFFCAGSFVALYYFRAKFPVGGSILILAGIWVIAGSLTEVIVRARTTPFVLSVSLDKIYRIFLAESAKIGGHIGIGMIFIGIAGVTFFNQETVASLKIGERFSDQGREYRLLSVETSREANYISEKTKLESEGVIYVPERRYYQVAGQMTTEADIRLGLGGDFYVTVSEGDGRENAKTIHVKTHPLIGFLWGGPLLMFLTGAFAYFRKRKALV